jgi:hypothetical protein
MPPKSVTYTTYPKTFVYWLMTTPKYLVVGQTGWSSKWDPCTIGLHSWSSKWDQPLSLMLLHACCHGTIFAQPLPLDVQTKGAFQPRTRPLGIIGIRVINVVSLVENIAEKNSSRFFIAVLLTTLICSR